MIKIQSKEEFLKVVERQKGTGREKNLKIEINRP